MTSPLTVLGCGFSVEHPKDICFCVSYTPQALMRKIRGIYCAMQVEPTRILATIMSSGGIEISPGICGAIQCLDRTHGPLVLALAGHNLSTAYPKVSPGKVVLYAVTSVNHACSEINKAFLRQLQHDLVQARDCIRVDVAKTWLTYISQTNHSVVYPKIFLEKRLTACQEQLNWKRLSLALACLGIVEEGALVFLGKARAGEVVTWVAQLLSNENFMKMFCRGSSLSQGSLSILIAGVLQALGLNLSLDTSTVSESIFKQCLINDVDQSRVLKWPDFFSKNYAVSLLTY